MKANSAQTVLKCLTDARVRFILVGGLAVNAYGYMRLTLDIDLVVQLVPQNLRRAFDALASLGYRSTVPVTAEQLGDAETRNKWVQEKGMRVLRFHCDEHWQTPVDLFVMEPFSFEDEFDRATIRELANAGGIHVVSLETLIAMKKAAGRQQDLADLDNLRLRPESEND